MRITCIALSLVAYCVAPGFVDARTWRVTPDGTGDAPSIEAAMDSAAAFDTVLVAPGAHVIDIVYVANGVVLIGEEGPLQTRLVPPSPAVLSGLACRFLNAPTTITGLWFDGFNKGFADGGAIADYYSVDITVSGCVFTNNYTGIVVDTDIGRIDIVRSTFVDNAIAIDIDAGAGSFVYNLIWGPALGLQPHVVVCNDVLRLGDVPPLLRFANFSLDPQFCGVDDFHISASSPCAPGNTPLNDDCGLIGALPVGCVSTPVQETTWGRVKALYRKP